MHCTGYLNANNLFNWFIFVDEINRIHPPKQQQQQQQNTHTVGLSQTSIKGHILPYKMRLDPQFKTEKKKQKKKSSAGLLHHMQKRVGDMTGILSVAEFVFIHNIQICISFFSSSFFSTYFLCIENAAWMVRERTVNTQLHMTVNLIHTFWLGMAIVPWCRCYISWMLLTLFVSRFNASLAENELASTF